MNIFAIAGQYGSSSQDKIYQEVVSHYRTILIMDISAITGPKIMNSIPFRQKLWENFPTKTPPPLPPPPAPPTAEEQLAEPLTPS